MDGLADVLKFLHFLSFVFMSVPLFNLIVVFRPLPSFPRWEQPAA
jgi:hypothetical protein